MSNYFTPATAIPPSKRGQPAWELAMLFPAQGHWSEEEYLALDTNHIVELVNGHLEVHPMASLAHQLILKFLFRCFDDFATLHKLALVLFAPFPVRIVPARCGSQTLFSSGRAGWKKAIRVPCRGRTSLSR